MRVYDQSFYEKKDYRPFVFPTETSIVEKVSEIVNEAANGLSVGGLELIGQTTENFETDAFGGVLDDANEVIYGGDQGSLADKGLGMTEYITEAIQDVTTAQDIEYDSHIDISTARSFIIPGSGLHDDSENLPYIILVVVLAILIVITIIALIIYHYRKKRGSKDITGVTVIGKTFYPSTLDEKEVKKRSTKQ